MNERTKQNLDDSTSVTIPDLELASRELSHLERGGSERHFSRDVLRPALAGVAAGVILLGLLILALEMKLR